MGTKSNLKSLQFPAAALLVLGILVAVNLLARPLRGLRLDLTEGNIYSLSEGTRELLKGLQRPVELKFYYSRDAEDMPVFLKRYAARVEDLLREYDAVGGDRVKLTVLNPEPFSDEEEWARKYGLRAAGSATMAGDGFYLGVVAVSGARESALPFLTPNDEARLEYNLSRMVGEVTRAEPPVVAVFSSLPVFGRPGNPMMGQPGAEPWLVIQQLRELAEVRELDALDAPVAEDVDCLILLHPKNLDDAARYHVDQFVVRGGTLIAAVDPLSLVERMNQPPQMMMMGGGGTASDLPELLAHWGLAYDPGQVLADLKLAAEHTARQTGERDPTFLLAREGAFNPDEIPTRGLEMVQLPKPGAFTVSEPPEGVEVAALISASDENAMVDAMRAAFGGGAALLQGVEPTGTERMIAARALGVFPSAFEAPPEGVENTGHLAAGERPGQVVAIADVDWLFDQVVAHRYTFMGQTVLEPIGDNLNLFLNLAEFATGNPELIRLRSRGTFERPFEVVNEMLREAETAGREQIEAIQREIREAESRINEIARTAGEEGALALNQALREEERALQEKVFDANRQLREIERERRRGVEALEFRLQVINILAMPALVGLLGLMHGLKRRRASNARAAA